MVVPKTRDPRGMKVARAGPSLVDAVIDSHGRAHETSWPKFRSSEPHGRDMKDSGRGMKDARESPESRGKRPR
jgi:hypothetical protein